MLVRMANHKRKTTDRSAIFVKEKHSTFAMAADVFFAIYHHQREWIEKAKISVDV